MANDPFFSFVKYLNHYNGLNGATVSPDKSNSNHVSTFVDNAQLSDIVAPFSANTSLKLDGAGDLVTVADSDDWAFGDGPFTVEIMVYFNAFNSGGQTLISQFAGVQKSWLLFRAGAASPSWDMFWSYNGSTQLTNAFTVAASTGIWYSVCLERDSSDAMRLYVDGELLKKNTSILTLFDSSEPVRIGDIVFNGHIAEARITKGIARYASDSGYAIATEPFPDLGEDVRPIDFNTAQEGDVLLAQTTDNGEMVSRRGIVEMIPGFETALYLSLFGGNFDHDGREESPLDYWGNRSESDPAFKAISRTQHLLRSLPATSGNLLRIEEAARLDLKWFIDKKVATAIEVVATIPGLNMITISVSIEARGEESEFEFTENWKSYLN